MEHCRGPGSDDIQIQDSVRQETLLINKVSPPEDSGGDIFVKLIVPPKFGQLKIDCLTLK